MLTSLFQVAPSPNWSDDRRGLVCHKSIVRTASPVLRRPDRVDELHAYPHTVSTTTASEHHPIQRCLLLQATAGPLHSRLRLQVPCHSQVSIPCFPRSYAREIIRFVCWVPGRLRSTMQSSVLWQQGWLSSACELCLPRLVLCQGVYRYLDDFAFGRAQCVVDSTEGGASQRRAIPASQY